MTSPAHRLWPLSAVVRVKGVEFTVYYVATDTEIDSITEVFCGADTQDILPLLEDSRLFEMVYEALQLQVFGREG